MNLSVLFLKLQAGKEQHAVEREEVYRIRNKG